MRRWKAAAFAVLVLFGPKLAFGHEGGYAFEQTVGQYHIDIHYPFVLEASIPVSLNFFLTKGEEAPVNFTDVDISILRDKEVILKTNVTKKIGIATAVTTFFPVEGNYRLLVTFNDGKAELVSTSFDVHVNQSSSSAKAPSSEGISFGKELWVGFGFGVLLTVGFWYLRRNLSVEGDDYTH